MKYLSSIIILLLFLTSCSHKYITKDASPAIFPDYTNVTIDRNIAPLNFMLQDEKVTRITTTFIGENYSFKVKSRNIVKIPIRKWEKLIAKGSIITVNVEAKKEGRWEQYKPFSIMISEDEMDDVLCYRRIDPGYATYNKMGIYQRDLSSFKEKPIIETTLLQNSCVNCHSFNRCSEDQMQFHIRGKNGGTVIMDNESLKKISGRASWAISSCVYPYWHPSGNYIIYSVNKTMQNFHNTPHHILDVYDLASDIVLYDVKRDSIIFIPALSDTTKFETFPSFSADGKTIYFSSALAKDPTKQLTEIQYGLYSISFNPDDATFGETIETVYSPKDQSILFARPSYDGKYIVFTNTSYGTFPIWHKDADLSLLDLESHSITTIDAINSNDTESYHSWSSNSRWLVFSSRRIDGLHTRPFIAHIDKNGNFSKPFLIPQKDPRYYERLLQSYNIPEFVNDEIDFSTEKLKKLL